MDHIYTFDQDGNLSRLDQVAKKEEGVSEDISSVSQVTSEMNEKTKAPASIKASAKITRKRRHRAATGRCQGISLLCQSNGSEVCLHRSALCTLIRVYARVPHYVVAVVVQL